MKNKIPRKFATLIENDVVGIDIVEARWGKEVSLSDSRKNKNDSYSEDEFDQLRNFLNEYKETILKVYEIKQQYTGVDEAWHIGKIAEDVISNKGIKNGDFALITQIGYTNDGTYTGQMRNVYNIFPNREYSQKHFGKSSMCELTQTVSESKVKEINKNAKKYDIKFRTYNMKVIRDIINSESLKETVEKSKNRKLLYNNLSDEDLISTIHDSYKLMNYDISKEDIKL